MTGARDAVLDHSDQFRITPPGDDVQDFDTRWDEVLLLSIREVPSDDILESVYKIRTRESDQLKTVLAPHAQEIEQHLSQPDNQKLKSIVKRCMDQKVRARNFEARNERIETEVLVKTRKGKLVTVERKHGECCRLKAKEQCTKGNACSFRHDESKRGKVTQSSSPAPKPLKTQNDWKSSSRGKPPRGRSPS